MIKYILRIFLIIFLSITLNQKSFSSDLFQIKKNFLIFLEKEFLMNNIKTKKVNESLGFIIFDLNNNQYVASFELLNKNLNQEWFLIPTIKIVRSSDNVSIGFARSLTFEKNSNLVEIENISKLLISSIIEQMKKNNIKFKITDQQFKDKIEKKIDININYFNSCEANQIIEVMEKEFPGFIHLESQGLSSKSKVQIAYFTTSTKFKIKKWLDLTMQDFNFNASDYFIKTYKSRMDVTKINKFKNIYLCEK
tara:strand:+ start:235 stop:987 length:753 start_codon:yes stop_codon:yes gene_type:complete